MRTMRHANASSGKPAERLSCRSGREDTSRPEAGPGRQDLKSPLLAKLASHADDHGEAARAPPRVRAYEGSHWLTADVRRASKAGAGGAGGRLSSLPTSDSGLLLAGRLVPTTLTAGPLPFAHERGRADWWLAETTLGAS
jgi:hypothetical protein